MPSASIGVLVEVDRQTDGIGAQDDGVHVGLDGHAHGFGRHAVAGQELALAVGGGAAVAPHRGDDERLVAHLAQRVDDRPGDPSDAADAPAADPHGDRTAPGDSLAAAGSSESTGGPFPARPPTGAGESIGERGPGAEVHAKRT